MTKAGKRKISRQERSEYMDIASACLAGVKCRFDGEARPDERIAAMHRRGEVKLVCPECLAGMKSPRCPSEISGGDGADVLDGRARVIAKDGGDRTAEFIEGARATLEAARACGAAFAYLKAKSPSCGCGRIYDGSFSTTLRAGDGVTTALLKRNGVAVVEV
jgi:uncharacterized protein YbbK (DUF523 family)